MSARKKPIPAPQYEDGKLVFGKPVEAAKKVDSGLVGEETVKVSKHPGFYVTYSIECTATYRMHITGVKNKEDAVNQAENQMRSNLKMLGLSGFRAEGDINNVKMSKVEEYHGQS